MSEQLGVNIDPDDPAPAAPVAVAEPAPPQAVPPPEDEEPEAIEVAPGHRMVPVSALTAVRAELKQLKPLAQQAAQLQQELDAAKPYIEFVKANPALLQPQAPPAPPVPPKPTEDPALIELARTLELYDTTGNPDVARAAKIRDLTRSEAASIAEQRIAPFAASTNRAAAAANLQAVMTGFKDAAGNPIDQQFVAEAIGSIASGMTEDQAVALLAKPGVMETIGYMALGRQAAARKPAPQPPAAPPLHVEAPGGAGGYVLSDSERTLARMTGRTEAEWAKSASRFKPGRANPLE